jgi:predicted transcriptional regulator
MKNTKNKKECETSKKEIGIVHLWDLPEDRVYLKLRPSVERKLLVLLLQICKSKKEIARRTRVSKSIIEKMFSRVTYSISLKTLRRLSLFLSKYDKRFELEELERKILYIRTKGSTSGKVFFPKFPINFNCKEGGKIIGALFGDGGLRKDLRPLYTNTKVERIREIVRSMQKVIGKFKVSKFIKVCSPIKSGSVSITYSCDFPKIIGIILHYGLGMENGDKVVNDTPLPSFCFKTSEEFKKGLLSVFFGDEAHVNAAGEDKAPRIVLRQAKLLRNYTPPRRLIGIKRLLEDFGLKPRIFLERVYLSKNGRTGTFTLLISRFDDTNFFFKKIGINHARKMKKLKKLLVKTTRKMSIDEYLLRKRLSSLLPIIKAILSLDGKNITSVKVASLTGRNVDSVKRILNKLAERGVLRIKEKGKPLNGKGHTCDIFEISSL